MKWGLTITAISTLLLATPFIRGADETVFDIPHVDNVTLDGKGDAWSAKAFKIDALGDEGSTITPRKDFAANIRLAWNEQGLLALATVTDPNVQEARTLDTLWERSCVEMFMATKVGGPDVWQFLVSPGVSNQFPNLRQTLTDVRKTPELKKIPLEGQAMRVKTPDGYVVEALLPWKNLAITPAVGQEFGFQIYVDHLVGGRRQQHAAWFSKLGAGHDTNQMQHLRLAEKASPPAGPAVWGSYEKFHDTRINIIAPADLAGKDIDVREQGAAAAVTTGKLAADGDRATASLTFAMPPHGKPYSPLHVTVGGQEQVIDLGDPEPARAAAIAARRINFAYTIMYDEKFPTYDFDDPTFAHDLLGAYTLTAEFYDDKFNKVQTAATPGRYGAIVDVALADGRHLHRFVTLFRSAKALNMDTFPAGGADIAAAGIDPTYYNRFPDSVNSLIGAGGLRDSRAPLNVVLATLADTDPGRKEPYTMASGPRTLDRVWWYQLQKKTGTFKAYHYLEYMPDGYDADTTKKWPMFVILHGSGAEGDDLQILKREHVVPENLGDNAKSRQFIVIAPQCHGAEDWNVPGVVDMIDDLCTKHRVDPDRIYLSGGSMGGFGAWAVAMAIPNRLAAVAILCGGADPADAPRVKDLPVWIFHGDHDPRVDFGFAQKMFSALTAINARTRFTIYAGGGHDIADQTYQPELYSWFLQQKRSMPNQMPTTQPTVVPAAEQ